MTDPAVEAARQAGGDVSSICHLVAVGAARAALKPIRELHFRSEDLECGELCSECLYRWPCETAKLIYREDEL